MTSSSQRCHVNQEGREVRLWCQQLIHFIIMWVEIGGRLDPALSMCELGVCNNPQAEEWVTCSNCHHAWHNEYADYIDNPFCCIHCSSS